MFGKLSIAFMAAYVVGCANGISSMPAQEPELPMPIPASNEQYPDDPRDFRADVTFSEDERYMIRLFLDRLSEKTGYHIGVVFDRPHTSADDKEWIDTTDRKVMYKCAGIVGGKYSGSGLRVIRLNPAGMVNAGQIAWVVAHEMGHDFGFDHVSKRGSLMSMYYYSDDDVWRWTKLDQAECERVGVCHKPGVTPKFITPSIFEQSDYPNVLE